MTVLIIEDEKKLVSILKRALKGERYSVDVAYDGKEGFDKAMKNDYALILLDLMLPQKGGIALCRELRKNEIHTPIIVITAKGSPDDRVLGLDVGADDYLIKPFGLDELLARMRAVLRRRKVAESDTKKVANLTMDKRKHEVVRAGKVVPLTPKEYKLLDTLLSFPGEVMTRRTLINHAWGPGFEETNNELNVHIRYLRKKIDGTSDKPLIHTVRGVGFVLKE